MFSFQPSPRFGGQWPHQVHPPRKRPVTPTTVPSAFKREATEVIPRLYISDIVTAQNRGTLIKLHISHVLSVVTQEVKFPTELVKDGKLRTKLVWAEDSPQENLLERLDETTRFIRDALESDPKHNVLVHCAQGISRSATVICAFLIATTGMGATEAINFLRSRRPIVAPNMGFVRQLEKYASQFYHGPAPHREERGRHTHSRPHTARQPSPSPHRHVAGRRSPSPPAHLHRPAQHLDVPKISTRTGSPARTHMPLPGPPPLAWHSRPAVEPEIVKEKRPLRARINEKIAEFMLAADGCDCDDLSPPPREAEGHHRHQSEAEAWRTWRVPERRRRPSW